MALPTVFSTVFPYMKRLEVEEAIEYVMMEEKEVPTSFLGGEDEGGEDEFDPFEEDKASAKLQQLAELFELYDVDGNGVVDVGEIKDALSDNCKLYEKRKGRGRVGSVVRVEDDEGDDIRKIVKRVNQGGKAELDFDQFVDLFKDVF